LNGGPSLESQELIGSKWRSDTVFKCIDGKKGTCLKATWLLQEPIYDYIELHLGLGKSEDEALELIQDVFNLYRYHHSGKPKLRECKKQFVELWGPISL
jgi:hypothetical protein